jgi:hypothetical protein
VVGSVMCHWFWYGSPRKEERTWTTDTYAPYDDGHQWRKYGEKKLSNSNFPRYLPPSISFFSLHFLAPKLLDFMHASIFLSLKGHIFTVFHG